MFAKVRRLVKEADPDVVEEWKWRGTPTWSHDGIVCTGETYENIVKMTFAKGASLKDLSKLFNSSLDGQRQACHRRPRGRGPRRVGLQGARPRGRRAQHRGRKEADEAHVEVSSWRPDAGVAS
jgi:Domain of unknown function (DU1801)